MEAAERNLLNRDRLVQCVALFVFLRGSAFALHVDRSHRQLIDRVDNFHPVDNLTEYGVVLGDTGHTAQLLKRVDHHSREVVVLHLLAGLLINWHIGDKERTGIKIISLVPQLSHLTAQGAQ